MKSDCIDPQLLQKYKSRDLLDLTCCQCNKPFRRMKKEIESNLRRGRISFCSSSCSSKYKNKKYCFGELTEVICQECGKITKKLSSQIGKALFCSSSCSAKYNNRLAPKKQLQGNCKTCSKTISSSRTYCKDCLKEYQEELRNKPLVEVEDKSRIRGNARSILKSFEPKMVCKNCGYDKHVECCHIKGVANFSLDTLVKEVNSKENLVWLYPNCHWELDHKRLTLVRISDSNRRPPSYEPDELPLLQSALMSS